MGEPAIVTEKKDEKEPRKRATLSTAAEYTDETFLAAFSTTIRDDIWTHTTFYTFTHFITEGRSDVFKGAAVIDVGCGDGMFARWAESQGATRVVGIDMSEQQIMLARKHEPEFGATNAIEYIAKDVRCLNTMELGEFDVAITSHLFCYAESRDTLRHMLNGISSCLKKGGRLVGVRECLDSASKGKIPMKVKGEIFGGQTFAYEVEQDSTDQETHCKDFCRCRNDFTNSDGSTVTFNNYLVRESTMLDIFTEAGFKINSYRAGLSCSPRANELFPADSLKSVIECCSPFFWYFDVTKL